jgi:hypothetical protein
MPENNRRIKKEFPLEFLAAVAGSPTHSEIPFVARVLAGFAIGARSNYYASSGSQ